MHVPAADGAFLHDGTFVALPPVPEALLTEGFRRAVLAFLVREHALSEELCSRMLGWRYSGFSVHNQVRIAAEEAEGRKNSPAERAGIGQRLRNLRMRRPWAHRRSSS